MYDENEEGESEEGYNLTTKIALVWIHLACAVFMLASAYMFVLQRMPDPGHNQEGTSFLPINENAVFVDRDVKGGRGDVEGGGAESKDGGYGQAPDDGSGGGDGVASTSKPLAAAGYGATATAAVVTSGKETLRPWQKVVKHVLHVAKLGSIVSGACLAKNEWEEHSENQTWVAIFSVKMALVFIFMIISSGLVGRLRCFSYIRKQGRVFSITNLFIGLGALLCGVMMSGGRTP